MRTFYEEWQLLENNSAVTVAELNEEVTGIPQIRQLQLPNFNSFPIEEFFQIGFTHHTAILSQVKNIEERCLH